MEIGTLAQIKGVTDREYKDVEVPEWGFAVRFQSWTAKDLDDHDADCAKRRLKDDKFDMAGLRIATLGRTLVNADGSKMFTNGDLETLAEKNGAVIKRLADEALRFNRIGEKAVEAEEKN